MKWEGIWEWMNVRIWKYRKRTKEKWIERVSTRRMTKGRHHTGSPKQEGSQGGTRVDVEGWHVIHFLRRVPSRRLTRQRHLSSGWLTCSKKLVSLPEFHVRSLHARPCYYTVSACLFDFVFLVCYFFSVFPWLPLKF